MIPFSKDFETFLIRPGVLAPEPVCATWAAGNQYGILHHTECHAWVEGLLRNPEILFLGANIAFDFGVVCAAWPDLTPLVFAAYENDRVTDVSIRQKMLDIAGGVYRGRLDEDGVWIPYRYSLDMLARRLLGVQLKKQGWRLRYQEFHDIPIERWISRAIELQAQARVLLAAGAPFGGHDEKDLQAILLDPPEQVITYAVDDARTALAVFYKQEPCAAEYLKSQFHEARAAWSLHLSSCWGMRTNAQGVEELRVLTEAAIVDVKARLIAIGLVRPDGSRDTKKASEYMVKFCTENNMPIRKTKGGGVSLDAEACIATEDPVLKDYERYTGLNKILTADLVMLQKGTVFPVHPRYDLAETGRTTCSGPNLQNVSKK